MSIIYLKKEIAIMQIKISENKRFLSYVLLQLRRIQDYEINWRSLCII